MAAEISGARASHLQKYIGEYATSADFAFQEDIRTGDVTIKSIVETILDSKTAQTFFANGWGQIIAAAYLLNHNSVRRLTFYADKTENRDQYPKAFFCLMNEVGPSSPSSNA